MTAAGRMVFLRNRMGLSQNAFAELMGRSVGYINRIENGRTEPTWEIVQAISETFGVPEAWLAEGTGFLNVESVGDRIRQARRSREYTQEELAEELGISRNSVGMMERGTIKCS